MLLLFHNRYIKERKHCLFAYLVALSHLSDVRFMPPWHQVDSSRCLYLTNGNNYSAMLGMNHLCTPIFLLASQDKIKLHSYHIHKIYNLHVKWISLYQSKWILSVGTNSNPCPPKLNIGTIFYYKYRNLMLYFWHHKIKWNYIHITFISRSLHLHNIYNLHVK